MSIRDASDGLRTVLSAISGLRYFGVEEIPDTINDMPCVLFLLDETDYQADFNGDYDVNVRLLVLLTKQDAPSAFSRALYFIEPAGDDSIIAKVKADPTLSGKCDTCSGFKNTGFGATPWGGAVYLSTEFTFTIHL